MAANDNHAVKTTQAFGMNFTRSDLSMVEKQNKP